MCASIHSGRLSDALCLQVPAFAVAGLVALQAAFMVFAIAGLELWVDDGNSLTKATMEADEPPDFTGAIGFMLHGMNGMMLIPLVALVLLIISFFAKIPGGPKWAGMVLGSSCSRSRSASSATSRPTSASCTASTR